MSDESPHMNKSHGKRVIQPLPGRGSSDSATAAVDMIRDKINQLHDQKEASEPNAKEELAEAKAAGPHRSKHQQFMYDLSISGKSLADIQQSWHDYYQKLPDKEKHEVWQEFYAEHSQGSQTQATAKVHPPQQTTHKPAEQHKNHAAHTQKSVSDIKKQIVRKAQSRAKPKNPHVQSILFGLAMGSIVVVITLFGFFNERLIAPFITPSRSVSSTAIISDVNGGTVGKESKIIIPKINVEIPVVYDEPSIEEDKVQKALERGVLHYATTPNPGEQGNAVIFGHSSNNILNSGRYKFAFVLLNRLENGDTFMLEKGGTRYVYKVYDKKVVSPKEVSVLNAGGDKTATATLITCDPPGTAINRLVVVGEQISPSPSQNVASSVKPQGSAEEPAVLPSNSPSLWSRMTAWL